MSRYRIYSNSHKLIGLPRVSIDLAHFPNLFYSIKQEAVNRDDLIRNLVHPIFFVFFLFTIIPRQTYCFYFSVAETLNAIGILLSNILPYIISRNPSLNFLYLTFLQNTFPSFQVLGLCNSFHVTFVLHHFCSVFVVSLQFYSGHSLLDTNYSLKDINVKYLPFAFVKSKLTILYPFAS